MFPYDASLAVAVATPPQSIADVIRIMEAIESTCEDGDGLKWFNWLYLSVTRAIDAGVSSSGSAGPAFIDPGWIAALDVEFAGLYFSALKSSLAGAATPGCWQALFDARSQTLLARIQFAFAGMNAHINHDLPLAVVATCQATGIAPQHGTAQYNDYTAVNTTLDALIDSAKQTLHVRLLGDQLPPVSHLDDTVAAWSMEQCRTPLAPWRCSAAARNPHGYSRWADDRRRQSAAGRGAVKFT